MGKEKQTIMSMIERMRKASGSALSALQAATQEGGNRSYDDDRFYYPERDESGAAQVVLRFLPQANPEEIPFVTYYRHFFKGDDGKWCIINVCPTTYGQDCPVCSRNSALWKTNDPHNQGISRERKRKKEYIANVLVMKDPRSPEKEGKVFAFKFGPAIYEKLKAALNPQYDDETAVNPFDLWEGADFFLRIRRDSVKKQITYEDSKFGKQSALYDGDESKLTKVLEQCIDLSEFVSKDKVESYDRLEEKAANAYADTVIGQAPTRKQFRENASTEAPKAAPVKQEPEFPEAAPSESGSADNSIDDFRKMLDEIPF